MMTDAQAPTQKERNRFFAFAYHEHVEENTPNVCVQREKRTASMQGETSRRRKGEDGFVGFNASLAVQGEQMDKPGGRKHREPVSFVVVFVYLFIK